MSIWITKLYTNDGYTLLSWEHSWSYRHRTLEWQVAWPPWRMDEVYCSHPRSCGSGQMVAPARHVRAARWLRPCSRRSIQFAMHVRFLELAWWPFPIGSLLRLRSWPLGLWASLFGHGQWRMKNASMTSFCALSYMFFFLYTC